MATLEILKRGFLPILLTAGISVAQTEPTEGEVAAVDTAAAPADSVERVWNLPEATEVSGDVSGYWNAGNYRITDVVTVPAEDTLYVAAGCTLYFDGPVERNKLHINALGHLEITGTDSLPVVMMSSLAPWDPNRIWGGVMYVGNYSGGHVIHTEFRHTEIGVQVRQGVTADAPGGLSGDSAYSDADADSADRVPAYILNRPTGPVTIRDCVIDSASFNGIVLVGVDSTVVVEYNLIQNCTSGISVETGSNPNITNNLVLNNVSSGIICSNNSSPFISDVTVIGSQTAGVICSNNSSPTIVNSVIAKCGMGLSVTGSSPIIRNCTIADNDFSGIIAYENAAPSVSTSNMRDNGLSGVDNRSSAEIMADRIWWGHIVTGDRPAPVLDAARRRADGLTVDAEVTGSVIVTNPLDGPSIDAPGTPDQAVSMRMAPMGTMAEPFGENGTVTNGDTIHIEMVARDESPHLEDQATVIISSTTSDPEGTARILVESGLTTGTYRGYVVASLLEGDPNVVVQVGNGDIIRVETGTTPPLSAQVIFVSKPPIISRLRVNSQLRGVSLIDATPTFSWSYVDAENDPQATTQMEISADPTFQGEPFWRNEETGRLLSYEYDGAPLAQGTTYYLRVRANDSYNWGRWRETNFHMNVPPPTPTPAYPDDEAVLRSGSSRPRIAANNIADADGDELKYIFEAYYGEDFENARLKAGGRRENEPVELEVGTDVTIWTTVPELLENTRCWWRVKSYDGLVESDWSEPRSFMLDTRDDEPLPFNMVEPQPDSIAFTVQPRLEWQFTYDPDPNQELSFIVSVGAESTFTRNALVREVSLIPEAIQYFQVPPERELLDNRDYYWSVKAVQNEQTVLYANDDDESKPRVWRFRVDTGNDPPSIQPIPGITMTEDTPHSARLARYIVDVDNAIEEIELTARSTPHIEAEVGAGHVVLLTPEADWEGGPETIRVEVRDPLKSVGVGEIRVTVRGTNDAPTTRDIPAQTIAEDTDLTIDLLPYARDIDNRTERLTWSASYDRSKLNVSINRTIATIRGAQDFTGTNVPIRFTATDPGGLSATTAAQVTFTGVNDEPAVAQIPPSSFREDESTTVSLDRYVTDPDNADADLVWSAVPDEPLSVDLNPTTRTARISAPENFGGATRRVVYTVRDPAGLSNQIVAQYEIIGVNDPPVLATIPAQQFNEDATLTVDLDPFVSDPDNAAREMRWTGRSARNVQVAIDGRTRRATFSAPSNWYGGPEEIQLTVADPGGLNVRRTFQVTVNPVPEAPQFARIPAATFAEDGRSVVALDDYLSDADHPNSRLTVAVTPPANVRAELDRSTRRITLSAPENWNGGPETVSIQASDPDNERASTTFTVQVTPVNDPPTLARVPAVSFHEDASTSLTLTEYVSDPDNRPTEMSWAFTGQRNVRVAVTSGVASFSAGANWNGAERLTLTVTDPGGLRASGQVEVTVAAVNDAPVLSTLPAVEFDEDGSSSVNLNALVDDVDNPDNRLTWRATGGQNVTVSVANGRASFGSARNWHGTESITLTVADPGGLEATGTMQATVKSVNDAPQISAIPAQRFDEDRGTSVELGPHGSDLDGDALTWYATSPNANLRAMISGSTLNLAAGENWNGGPISVAISAADPGRLSANATVQVTVAAVNDAPVLSTLPAVEFDEDGSSSISLNAVVDDPDNTDAQLTWRASGGQNVTVSVANGRASFGSARNWHGTERITLTVADPGGLEATGTMQVTVKAVNDAPQISAIPAQRFDEDRSTAVELGPHGSDLDGDALTWYATSPNASLRATISGSTLNLSAEENWNGGPISVAISAADPGRLSANSSVQVTVAAVNDAPVLSALPAVEFDEDGTSSINLNALIEDVDNSDAQLTWRNSGGQNVTVAVSNGRATFRAPTNWHGTERITFTAADPGGLEANGSAQVTVKSVNDAPAVSAIPAQQFAEDQSATVSLASHGSDLDGDALTWSATSANSNVRASVSGATLNLSAAQDWNGGPATVTVTASDPGGLSANAAVRVTVSAVNDAPTLSAIPAVQFDEDGSTSVNVGQYAGDVDNRANQLTWRTSGAQSVTVAISGGQATLRAAANWHGSERVTFTVSDPGGLAATATAQVTVRSVNDVPQVSAIPAATFGEDEGTSVDLARFGSDADGDALTWAATSANQNVRASVSGSTLNLSAAANWNGGPISVAVSASDPSGGSANSTVRVTVTAVNDPPALGTLPAVRFDEDGTGRLALNSQVSDPDDTPAQLSWSASGNTNVRVNISGGAASFSAGSNWNGSERITFTVRDRGGLSASQAVSVTVNAVNDPPVMGRISSATFDEDGNTTVDLSGAGSDPDGDRLSYTATSSDANVRASVTGATLNLSAAANWNGGPVSVAVSASDPSGASASGTVSVTVRPVNDPPELRALPPVTFDEDGTSSVDFSTYASDLEDAPARMNWSTSGGQNVRVRFSGATATFSAGSNWNGGERVTINMRDRGGASVSQTVSVTVNPVNDAPVVDVSGVNMASGSTENIDLSRFASDPDGDGLTWEYLRQTGSLEVELNGSTLRVSAPAGSSGTSVMVLRVADGSGAGEEVRLSVTVTR